mmetsp:Transcript_28695/g.84602  ORF Transcript_28695/g.84602 Transcript_28695/m.84602 type:complete len:339 (+) Transcript_28695:1797-2813(+)
MDRESMPLPPGEAEQLAGGPSHRSSPFESDEDRPSHEGGVVVAESFHQVVRLGEDRLGDLGLGVRRRGGRLGILGRASVIVVIVKVVVIVVVYVRIIIFRRGVQFLPRGRLVQHDDLNGTLLSAHHPIDAPHGFGPLSHHDLGPYISGQRNADASVPGGLGRVGIFGGMEEEARPAEAGDGGGDRSEGLTAGEGRRETREEIVQGRLEARRRQQHERRCIVVVLVVLVLFGPHAAKSHGGLPILGRDRGGSHQIVGDVVLVNVKGLDLHVRQQRQRDADPRHPLALHRKTLPHVLNSALRYALSCATTLSSTTTATVNRLAVVLVLDGTDDAPRGASD